jgi:hypothetical protein
MLFSVIYSVDCQFETEIGQFNPRRSLRRHLQLTEGDECREYDYLGDDWANHKHRKWAGILTRPQFEALLDDTGMWAESTETMGSLGAPGFGFGLAPAISFRNDDPQAIQGMYVTPIPCVDRVGGWTERDFERIKRAIVHQYGSCWEFKFTLYGEKYHRACCKERKRAPLP